MLLPRKSDHWAELEAKVWRSTVREQQNSSSLQIEADGEITILPYAYFQEARCRKQGTSWGITLYWPWVMVCVTGRNLEKMPGMIAEHGLASLQFHPEGERGTADDRPELDSLALIPRSEDPALPPSAERKSPAGTKASYRYSQSIG
jgi:hypothetical protein